MRKTFILDTNVVLYEAESIFKFDEHNVVIPNTVLEEVDKFKKNQDEIGRNARRFTRYLDELRAVGPMTEGVPLNGDGGKLFVKLYTNDMAFNNIDMNKPDNRILAVAFNHPGVNKELVTKDVNLRVTAGAFGVPASDYEHEKVDIDTLYAGIQTAEVPSSVVDAAYSKSGVQASSLAGKYLQDPPYPNEFIILVDECNPSHTAVARYFHKAGIIRCVNGGSEAWGLTPRNVEQRAALELLLDDSIRVVTLVGKAGTGKTLMAIAVGLTKVAEEYCYRKLLVSRPVIPMGRDIGYLPGDVNEKLSPWMQPIYDNLDFLLDDYNSFEEDGGKKSTKKPSRKPTHDQRKGKGPGRYKKDDFEEEDSKDAGRMTSGHKELVEMGILQVEPLMYIRGRSIPKQFMIVDEAQGLTPHEVKTILTRAGEGTKIVLTGDPAQVDNPFLDAGSNGLTYVVERFKHSHLAGHITLTKGERSELAELASNTL